MAEQISSITDRGERDLISRRLEFYAGLGIIAGLILQPLSSMVADFIVLFLHDMMGLRIAGGEKFITYLVFIAATTLLVWGGACLAMSKGHHWAWGLLAIASCIGLVFVTALPNRHGITPGSPEHRLMVDQRNAVVSLTVSVLLTLACWPIFRILGGTEGIPAHVYVGIAASISLLTSICGSYYLVRRKGYHVALSAAGLLSCIGWVALFLLPDRHRRECPGLHDSLRSFAQAIVLLVIFGSVLTAIDVPMGISYIRAKHDRAVSQNLAHLGTALVKFADERARMDCSNEVIPEDIIHYMVGPHYGWFGTGQKAILWVDRGEVRACALEGQRLDNGERYIYRLRLVDGASLPATQGRPPVGAKSYGGPGTTCYTEGVVGTNCTFRTPQGRPCQDTEYWR